MLALVLLVPALAGSLAGAPPARGQGVGMAALDPASAALIRDVVAAAGRSFDRLPQVRLTSAIAQVCGGDARTDMLMRYCTSQNLIFVSDELAARVSGPGEAAYRIGHLLGHGVQVRHGIADIALARIRAEPGREPELRGMVERQNDCLAGVFAHRAGLRGGGRLADWVGAEPYAGAHWGRAPLSRGPVLAIGLAARSDWFERGRARGALEDCAVGEFGAELLLRARRGR